MSIMQFLKKFTTVKSVGYLSALLALKHLYPTPAGVGVLTKGIKV